MFAPRLATCEIYFQAIRHNRVQACNYTQYIIVEVWSENAKFVQRRDFSCEVFPSTENLALFADDAEPGEDGAADGSFSYEKQKNKKKTP